MLLAGGASSLSLGQDLGRLDLHFAGLRCLAALRLSSLALAADQPHLTFKKLVDIMRENITNNTCAAPLISGADTQTDRQTDRSL